jgi:hypothetical protein
MYCKIVTQFDLSYKRGHGIGWKSSLSPRVKRNPILMRFREPKALGPALSLDVQPKRENPFFPGPWQKSSVSNSSGVSVPFWETYSHHSCWL